MRRSRDEVLVLGAGLTGLSAAHALAGAGRTVKVVERSPSVGGLARTVERGAFRFDLGGHRFFTPDRRLESWVRGLVGSEGLTVARRSQILLRGRRIEYPLRPLDAIAGLGPATISRIVLDYARERLRGRLRPREPVSLEDWVVAHFGRTLFDLYFKVYSEKVWGIGCAEISRDWVAQRIQGLSLGSAIRNAFVRRRKNQLRTLTDHFLYPSRGIGTIAERLREGIEGGRGEVLCNVEVGRIRHEGDRVTSVTVRDGSPSRTSTLEAGAFVSTLPLTDLVRMLEPRPPREVLGAAASLRFRDLVVVAVMLDRPRATDQSWMYFPDREIPFGRIHEPTNWSHRMAPEGKTLLVAEQFCFRGDGTWTASDEEIAGRTVESLCKLGIVARHEVHETAVVRVPKAYPLFEVGYAERCETIRRWLGGLRNLFLAGRGGTFRYLNMDHAMAAGLETAAAILASGADRLEAPGAAPARQTA